MQTKAFAFNLKNPLREVLVFFFIVRKKPFNQRHEITRKKKKPTVKPSPAPTTNDARRLSLLG
ncbi:MAG: hypothetical protein RLP09_02645 [Sandaracinaceae bacterium]